MSGIAEQPLLEIRDLYKSYGDQPVLAGLSLALPPRRRLALLGPNGAGKSTLLRIVCGLVPFDAGSIDVAGYPLPRSHSAVKPLIGYLPDDPPLYDQLSPMEFFEYVAALWGLKPDEARERAEGYLRLYQLWHERDSWLGGFSKGMRRKVALIGLFIRTPSLLLLDEPFDGLDAAAIQTTIRLLREFTERRGALLFATHALDLAEELATHGAVLAGGRVRSYGPLAGSTDLAARYAAAIQANGEVLP